MGKRIRKAIFPVGGLGTRFLPATKAMPKEMLPVVDKPLIQYAVEEARAAGIEEFVFVTGRGKISIEDHFDHCFALESTLVARGKKKELKEIRCCLPRPGQVAYIRQQEPLGLGHAIWCARNPIENEPFAVLLADDLILADRPCLQQMMDAYESVGGNMVAVMDVPRSETEHYGILDIQTSRGRLVQARALVEKPGPIAAPSTHAVIGRYILDPDVLCQLETLRPGAGGEIQRTDGIGRTIGDTPFHGFRFSGTRFDCGSKVGFLEANIAFALARSDLALAVLSVLRRRLSLAAPSIQSPYVDDEQLEREPDLAVGA